MSYVRRTPPPYTPWCLIFKEEFGLFSVLKVPMSRADLLCRVYGWRVLVTDIEVPLELGLGQEWMAPAKKPFYPPQSGEQADD